MPSMRQPKQLRMSCVNASSDMIISLVLSSPEPIQERSIQKLLHKFVPPIVLQDVLTCVMQQLGSHHSSSATPSIISCLLRILLHPKLTDVCLSELSYIGNVELDSLDLVEATLIKQLPLMSELTYLDLSTHLNKITFPSCSNEILEVLGSCCPHLKVLDVNFNNRVTGEGLLHLYPSDNHPGCLKLERLFMQDCSIEPEDVAMIICSFPNLQIIGYKELGTSLQMIRKRPRKYGLFNRDYCLKLTHVDNTMSKVQRCDGYIVDFLGEACPYIENLKIRVSDEDVNKIHKLDMLRHLELRYYTGFHHPVGTCTLNYLRIYGSNLSSFTIYCNRLHSQHVLTITESCVHLKKLFLHANIAIIDVPLDASKNKLHNLELLNLRLGDDELRMSPAACDLVLFLLKGPWELQELYIMVRSPEFHHDFISNLLRVNPLSHLKNLIIDVPKRTLVAPMLELTVDTAFLLINSCAKLKILGNLICWDITPHQVSKLRNATRVCNYNLTIIHAHSNKLNTKYL